MAGFSAFALVAFTVAFALAAQGGGCGPGCDALGTRVWARAHDRPERVERALDHRPKHPTTTTATARAGTLGTSPSAA